MPDGWTNTLLGDCGSWLSGGTPSKARPDYWNGNIPWMSAKDMKQFRLYDAEDHISAEGAKNGTRVVPAGTILLLIRGMTLHNDVPVCVAMTEMAFNQDVKAIIPGINVNKQFLAYWFVANKPYLLSLVDSASHGTGRLYPEVLKQIPLLLPPIEEQNAIASVLSALDDKIELNHRMNETIEAMARALFQSWFVDFDPVRARMEGRQPFGMDVGTAALFPCTFDNMPQGQVPTGWEVGRLQDAFNLTMGQSPPGESYNSDGIGIPFYQGKTDFGFRFPNVRVHCTAPTRHARKGDTLVSVRAPVGEVNVAIEPCAIGRGVAAVRHKSGSTSYTYYSMQAMRAAFMQYEGEGTVFGSINKSDFQNLKMTMPSSNVIEAFEQIMHPLDQRIEINAKQTQSLSIIRDTLLPKLMSDEVRVRDAEKTVEAVL